MKIAIIIERANISLGGAERSVLELGHALTGLGHQVSVLAATGHSHKANVRFLCEDTGGRRTDLAVFAEALKKHIREEGFDIIHSVLPFDFADVYQPRGGTYAESIVRNAASYENPLIETCKKLTAFVNRRRNALLKAERSLCQGSKGPVIAALSQYVASQLTEHYQTPDSRIVLIKNGVRTDRRIDPRRTPRLRTQILSELNLKERDNPFLMLFAANNFRLKGLTPLIRALAMAQHQKNARNSYLVIAGNAKPHRYIALARKLNVHNRLVFLGPVKQIQNVLAITDIAVLPTYYDPASRFILEAIVAGNPVITTRFNGAADLFETGRHGTVIDSPENIQALSEAIVRFNHPEQLKKSIQAIADDHLKDSISVKRAALELNSLYQSILKRKGR